MPRIPINSIEINDEHRKLCMDWNDGEGCRLWVIGNYGCLIIDTTDTDCPDSCDGNLEKWYLVAWRELSDDADYAVHCGNDGHDADYQGLVEFASWIDSQVERLERSYGLADWNDLDD